MKIDWTGLREELAIWGQSDLRLPIWWRDDDAEEPSPKLDRLRILSTRVSVPVHLAVIPANATSSLGEYVDASSAFVPIVHGWTHQNHAEPDAKKAEFGTYSKDISMKAADGLDTMKGLFGRRLAPMFVPPWNRIDPAYYPDLVKYGYRMISTHTPREFMHPVDGLSQINTHVDPIDWRGTRGLIDPETLVSQIVAHLRNRRFGTTDIREPFGFLTHHLVHTEEIWDFTEQFFCEISEYPIEFFTANQNESK